jgi:hypothetical protein
MPKPWGKVKTFQSEWTLRYGLEVSTSNPSTREVTSVLCLFCHQFGWEDEDVERKRKRTTNLKYSSYPWRSDNFNSHLKQQHQKKWNEYTCLSAEDKPNFCEEWICWSCQHAIFCPAGREYEGSHHCKATMPVNNWCWHHQDNFGFLFNNSEEEGEKDNSFNIAKKNTINEFVCNYEDNTFVIEVKSVLTLKIIANFVAVGVSLWKAYRLYQ